MATNHSEPNAEILQVFRRNVPEIAAGTVEIVSLAREAGRRICIAVRSHDPKVSPVQACSPSPGPRLKTMIAELGGEHFSVLQWHSSPEQFISNAFFGPGLQVALDSVARQAVVTIDMAARKPDRLVPIVHELTGLVSKLTGWEISVAKLGTT